MSNRMNLIAWVLFVALAIMSARGESIYVDNDAPSDPGPNDPEISDPKEDGSLAHPFDAIQEAIDASIDGDEVVVLNGTYTGSGNYNINPGGKAITIRSASGPQATVIDGEGDHGGFVIEQQETQDTIIEGFTVHDGFQFPGGSGFLVRNDSSPIIRNCIITNGYGFDYGGGIHVINGAAPTIVGCTIANNWSDWWGGGIAVQSGDVVIRDCVFTGNNGPADGGGVWLENFSSSATIMNCVFAGNKGGAVMFGFGTSGVVANCVFSGNTRGTGAGVVDLPGDVVLSNCTFLNNVANSSGAALSGDSTIGNCIFWENDTEQPGDPDPIDGKKTIVLHSIVEGGWEGDGEAVIDADPQFQPSVSGTWTQPAVYDSASNRTVLVDANASFKPGAFVGRVINPDNSQALNFYIVSNSETTIRVPGDFTGFPVHVSPEAGDAYTVFNPRVTANSPAIDAGSNLLVPDDTGDLDGDDDVSEPVPFDFDGVARFIDVPDVPDTGVPGNGFDAIVDIGAFEFTATTACVGDLDANEIVGLGDLLALLSVWGPCESCAADLNADGMVDISDLLELLGAWGPCG